MKENILKLRSEGYTYNQIKNILNCSKGTISFHCGENQRGKYNNRLKKNRKNNPLQTKIHQFHWCNRKRKGSASLSTKTTLHEKLKIKLAYFSENENGVCKMEFSVKDLLGKIGDDPKCYLTGRKINLNESSSYHLDHIIPKSKGGTNNLDNCQIACKQANQAKSDLTLEEFYKLCEEVLKHKSIK